MKFQVVYNKILDEITLYAADSDFLDRKLKSIKTYTANVDPNFTLEQTHIELVTVDDSLFNEGFMFKAQIASILPRIVRVLYGNNGECSYFGNCHSAAVVASGMGYVLDQSRRVKAIDVTYETLTAGDRVSLIELDHSFVYIDPDLCISMNGVGKSLELQSLTDVLNIYHAPSDLLSLKNEGRLYISRRVPDSIIPDSFLVRLLEYYSLVRKYTFFSDTRHDSSTRLVTILFSLKNALKECTDVNMKKEHLEYIYNLCVKRKSFQYVLDSLNIDELDPGIRNIISEMNKIAFEVKGADLGARHNFVVDAIKKLQEQYPKLVCTKTGATIDILVQKHIDLLDSYYKKCCGNRSQFEKSRESFINLATNAFNGGCYPPIIEAFAGIYRSIYSQYIALYEQPEALEYDAKESQQEVEVTSDPNSRSEVHSDRPGFFCGQRVMASGIPSEEASSTTSVQP